MVLSSGKTGAGFLSKWVLSYLLFGAIIAITFSTKESENLFEGMVKVGPYFVSEFPLPWEFSRQHCLNLNKSLITVENVKKDQELVYEFIDGGDNGNVSLPGNVWAAGKETVEGVWAWDTGANGAKPTPFYHTRWFVGQPDAIDDINCVYLATAAFLYWRDANCSAAMYFICE